MPRPRTKKNRWDHTSFRWAYCYERDGMVYTAVYGHRRSTGLIWNAASKPIAMRMLSDRVRTAMSLDDERPNITIHVAIRSYLEEKKMQISVENYQSLRLALSHIPNCDWTDGTKIRKTVLQCVNGLSNWTIANRLGYIRAFFQWCIDNDYIKKNPILKHLTPQKKRNEQRSAFTEEEMTTILNYSQANDPQLYELLLFLSKTGLRVGEAMQLTSSDIDDEYIRVIGKGQYIRYIPYRAIEFGDDIEIYRQKKGRLFLGGSDKWKMRLMALKTAVNLNDKLRSFHSIRKYFENKLIKEKKIEPRIVAELLGHTLEIQQKHYYEIMNKNELKDSLNRAKTVQNSETTNYNK